MNLDDTIATAQNRIREAVETGRTRLREATEQLPPAEKLADRYFAGAERFLAWQKRVSHDLIAAARRERDRGEPDSNTGASPDEP